VPEGPGRAGGDSVDEGAARRPEIVHVHRLPSPLQARVRPAHKWIVETYVAFVPPADDQISISEIDA
jgi:hypothetical protein